MTIRELVRLRRPRPVRPSLGAALAGVAAGAAALALLEPRGGAGRRARVVQKMIHAGKALEDFGEKAAHDLANRSRGLVASTRSSFRGGIASPEVLCERVRSRLGRLTSHPGTIEVTARGDSVELRGPVLAAEADEVIAGIRAVRGVREVVDRLERHAEPGNVPRLEGGAGRPRPAPEIVQQNWAPGTRLVAIVLGSGLVARGLRFRAPAAIAAGAAGAFLALRGATNLPLKRLVGVGARRRAVDIRKAIHVEAPREEVFAFFRAFENFPRFMTHVRDVRRAGEGRWHWTVEGPARTTVEWDAEVSAFVPNEIIGWRTTPGARVESSGIARFDDEGGGTRLDIRLSYNPPGGVIGHGVAVLLGADPKRRMDDDLLRLKSLLERGKAEGVTREEVRPGPGA